MMLFDKIEKRFHYLNIVSIAVCYIRTLIIFNSLFLFDSDTQLFLKSTEWLWIFEIFFCSKNKSLNFKLCPFTLNVNSFYPIEILYHAIYRQHKRL